MSLITQCPACATLFRVVPDQLRISEGWVRCGKCDEVFDAHHQLRTLEGSVAAPHPATAQPDLVPPPTPQPTPSPEPAMTELRLPPQAHAPGPGAQEHRRIEPSLEMPVAPPVDSAFDSTDTVMLPPQWQSEQQDTVLMELPELDQVAASLEAADGQPGVPARLSFMQGAADAPAQHGWLRRSLEAGVALVLALLLLGQFSWQMRDAIAAKAPALQPVLQSACDWLGCTLSPLREIESIAIESSSFTSVRPGVYLLNVTLKNAATNVLAMPALELTLTDAQDRPVLRRVLQSDALGHKPVLAAGVEFNTSLPLSLSSAGVPEKITGYKVLAFYP